VEKKRKKKKKSSGMMNFLTIPAVEAQPLIIKGKWFLSNSIDFYVIFTTPQL